jgi:hypothetical protein
MTPPQAPYGRVQGGSGQAAGSRRDAPDHTRPRSRHAAYLPLGANGRPLSRRADGPPPGGHHAPSLGPPLPGTPPGGMDPRSLYAIPHPAAYAPERRSLLAAVRRIPREHTLFCTVLLVATIVRIVVMLGYPPALWYPDSLPYISAAIHPEPFAVRPIGYSFLLWALRPFHSIAVVSLTQHAMGLASGAAVYALLRRRFGLRAWAATLASIPSLLSAYAIQIEHFVLSDTFFALLVTIAVALVLWREVPPIWVCVLSGLILAGAALVRSQGLPLILPFAVYLVARLPRRRVLLGILAIFASFAIPLLGYARWFDQVNGSFQLTTSTGAFLYSRVATFADCSVIRPPADERWLCLSAPASKREYEAYYVWDFNSPIQHGPGSEFSAKVNSLATDFALRAIEAQPFDYLRTVWDGTARTFQPGFASYADKPYLFPAATPESLRALAVANYSGYRDEYTYNDGDPSTRVVEPFAGWVRFYQRLVVLPPPLLLAIVLTGLIGMPFAWRRFGGPALLPWLTGLVIIVMGPATADFDSRYVVAGIPALCAAAALSLKQIGDFYATGTQDGSQDPVAAPHNPLTMTAGGAQWRAE